MSYESVIPAEVETTEFERTLEDRNSTRRAIAHIMGGSAALAAEVADAVDTPYIPPVVKHVHVPGEGMNDRNGHFTKIEEKKPNAERGYL